MNSSSAVHWQLFVISKSLAKSKWFTKHELTARVKTWGSGGDSVEKKCAWGSIATRNVARWCLFPLKCTLRWTAAGARPYWLLSRRMGQASAATFCWLNKYIRNQVRKNRNRTWWSVITRMAWINLTEHCTNQANVLYPHNPPNLAHCRLNIVDV